MRKLVAGEGGGVRKVLAVAGAGMRKVASGAEEGGEVRKVVAGGGGGTRKVGGGAEGGRLAGARGGAEVPIWREGVASRNLAGGAGGVGMGGGARLVRLVAAQAPPCASSSRQMRVRSTMRKPCGTLSARSLPARTKWRWLPQTARVEQQHAA